jgi:uncharacterized OB-fold protein
MPEEAFNHASYTALLGAHRLMGSRCAHCGTIQLPPRALCPKCYHQAMEWFAFSGEGTLEGFTTIHVGLPEMVATGYNREQPYCSGVVRLAEGPAISGQIVGVDARRPETIHIGMKVRATFIDRETGAGPRTVLAFEPIQAG